MDEYSEKIRGNILSMMDFGRDYEDEEIRDMIAEEVDHEARARPLSISQRIRMEEDVFNSLRRLDILQPLIDDPEITEILVNGSDTVFYEKGGSLYRFVEKFSTEEKLLDMVQNIVGRHNRVVNQSSPIVDTRLPDGSRVNIVLSPVSIDGTAVSIRKFPKKPFDMEQLISIGSLDRRTADFLKVLVKARYSIFISGGTGSGKTTFLNALSQYIPKDERIITIEDSAELQLLDAENLVRLETRNASREGLEAITIRDLIRTALRMRPDRIIVGECRGGEALDMLTAMNTGHDGSLSTGHANSCRDILSRLETMVLMGSNEIPMEAVRKQIASGIDLIIQLGRLRDKSRRVLEIAEVDGMEKGEIRLNTIFRFRENKEQADGIPEADHEAGDKKISAKEELFRNQKNNQRVEGQLCLEGHLIHREKLLFAGMEGEIPDGL